MPKPKKGESEKEYVNRATNLVSIGLKGKEMMLLKLYADKVDNNKEDLLALLNPTKQNEGVGDRYAEKAFGIPANDDQFEKEFSNTRKIDEEPVAYVDNTPIYKNPKSLNSFDSYVRAISDSNGDLYVAKTDGGFVHDDMANEITRNCSKRTRKIYRELDKYLLLRRIASTNSFGLSDTNAAYVRGHIYDDDGVTLEVRAENMIDLINAVGRKNPQYKFNHWYYDKCMDEGVGNKYLERKFGFEPEIADFDKKYDSKIGDDGNIVGYVGDDIPVFKNPKSLNGFGMDVRAKEPQMKYKQAAIAHSMYKKKKKKSKKNESVKFVLKFLDYIKNENI